MATVTMPQLGESVTEGTILSWLKQPGDTVHLDDPLCEIETEKVTAELPSPFEGTMGRILVPQGETVTVGAPLCEVTESAVAAESNARASGGWSGGPMAIPPEEGDGSHDGAGAAVREGVPAAPAAAPPVAVAERILRSPDDRSRFYSPAVLRLAAERGVDLAGIEGTGVAGRVTRKDVERYLAAAPTVGTEAAARQAQAGEARPATAPAVGAERGYETVQMTATRRTIAENMVRANREAPQAWTMVEADVTGLVRRRDREKERFEREEGVALTLLPYFTAAVCETLREFPMLNARWEGEELRRYHALHIGIAVATDAGLVVPVVHDAGDLSVTGLTRRIADLAQRGHARKLRLEDVEGGTFTVNNTGAFGSIASKPIVNYPQVAIVSMERAVRRPVALTDDGIAVRWMMNVCLSFDHRAMDGLEAGGFLAALKGRLEAIA